MFCRNCKFAELLEDTGGLYICCNPESSMYKEYTGLLCEDDCEDGEDIETDWLIIR